MWINKQITENDHKMTKNYYFEISKFKQTNKQTEKYLPTLVDMVSFTEINISWFHSQKNESILKTAA